MPLWLPPEAARIHPLAVDRMLVETGLAPSLTAARRFIAEGAIYLNNVKLVPPEKGFLPVVCHPGMTEWNEFIADALREGGWFDGDAPQAEAPA